MEVPCIVPMELATSQWGMSGPPICVCCVLAESVHPGANTSGLMRPSHVGPRELNSAMVVPASSSKYLESFPVYGGSVPICTPGAGENGVFKGQRVYVVR